MEKIKQAIEKAKLQGGEEVERQRPAAVQTAPTSEISEIIYQQTRVVELNPHHLAKNRIVALNKSDLNSVSFDLLRTQVLQKMEEHGWRTLAIVSPVTECGKTVVAINLAMSIAHHTSKTAMLVDFDLRKPKIAEYLGLPAGKSLNDVLEGDAAISETFVNPGIPKLVVVPAMRPIRNSAELLASDKVKKLVHDLRDRYKERIVIFDLPPLLNVDDAISVLPRLDCALMVVGNGMVTKLEMEESLHHLQATNLLGVILNKAEVQSRNYDY
ncbi:MAG: CpsD/CapB family tyrosine-protein kinase [Georgfuchsia sp.]